MRRILLVSSIALMAMNSGLYAQEKDTTQGESKVEVKVVYEKTFDEPIVDVIFDTATVSIEKAKKMGWKKEAFTLDNKAKGKVLISYPKVVLVSHSETNELKFYDKNGRLINGLVLKKYENGIHYSPNKKRFLVSRIPTEWNPSYSGGTLYDLDGKKIWEIEGPSPIAVSDEGYAIAAYLDWQVPPERGGDFYVYDSKGKLLKTIENPLKEKTAPLFAKYSKDGEYALLGFKAETYPPTVFTLITKEGQILWKKELLEYRFPGRDEYIDIFVGKGIAVASGFFIDWQGNLKWKYTLRTGGDKRCVFSQNGEMIYICATFGYLWGFDSNNGNVIWMHKEPWSPPFDDLRLRTQVPRFTEMFEQERNLVLKGSYTGQVTWYSSKIFVFDSKIGELKKEIEYPDKKIYLSPHSGKIFVINVTDKKIQGLKIEEE